MKRIEKKLIQYTEITVGVVNCLDGYGDEYPRILLSYYVRTRFVDTLKYLYGYEDTVPKYLGTKIHILASKYLDWLGNTKHFTSFDLAGFCTKIYVPDMQDTTVLSGLLNFKESLCPGGIYQTDLQTTQQETYSDLIKGDSKDKVWITIDSLLVSQTVITEADVFAVYPMLVSECYESFGKNLEGFSGYTTDFIYPPLSGDFFFSKKNAVFTNVLQLFCYCNVVSKLKGLEPVYTIFGDLSVGCDLNVSGYRLPTMYEWRYLAYANEPFLKFPGSDHLRDVVVALDNTLDGQIRFDEMLVLGKKMPQGAVARLKPNGFLLYDMLGLAPQLTTDLNFTIARDVFDGIYPELEQILRSDTKNEIAADVSEYFYRYRNKTIERILKNKSTGEAALYEFSNPCFKELDIELSELRVQDKVFDPRPAIDMSYRLTNELGLGKKIKNKNLAIKEKDWTYWREYFGPKPFHPRISDSFVQLTNGYNLQALGPQNIVPAARLVRRY